MCMRYLRLLLLLLAPAFLPRLMASDSLRIEGFILKEKLIPHASLFVDKSGKLSLEEILQSPQAFQESFETEQASQYPEVYWLHVPIIAETALQQALLVIPGDSLRDEVHFGLDYFEFFLLNESGEMIRHEKSGFLTPQSEKSLKEHPLALGLPISLEAGKRYSLYVRLQNVHRPQRQFLGVELRGEAIGLPRLNMSDRWEVLGPWGMFVIIGMLAMVLFFYVRDRAFLYFGIFCFLYSFDLLAIEPAGGLVYLFSWQPTLARPFFQLCLFSVPFMLLFGHAFIDVKTHFPAWNRYYLASLALISLVVVAYFVRAFWPPYILHAGGFLLSLLLIIPVGVRFIWSKNWTARIFAIGFFSFLGGNVVGVIAMSNNEPWAALASAMGQFGLLFIFTIGLGYRFLEGERKQAQVEKIQELDQLKTRFFTNISHEFRTPLSLILGPLQHAEENIPGSELENSGNEIPVKAGHIQVMKRNALRLQQLIDQILDISKIESGKMRLKLQQGAVVQFIRSRVAEFSDIAHKKRIHLITNYLSENKEAIFDPDKLEKIMVNILSNAIKYTPENGEIYLSVKADSRTLSVSVADNGEGMSKAETDQIFDRFYQSDKSRQQGSGIGMALVKELIELHQGQIRVESQLGKGTTISFSLKIHAGDFQGDDFQPAAQPLPPSLQESLKTQPGIEFWPTEATASEHENLVLIVEDNPDLQAYMQELLQDSYQLILARDGQEGIEMAREHLPDLIISDVMMPRLSGIELCDFVKKEEKTSHIPVILLTAKAEQRDKWQGLSSGADDYLTKPFDAKELKLKMENIIQSRRLLKEKYSQQPWSFPEVESLSMEEKFLQQVASTIRENMGNEYFSVEELGKEIGYSRSQLFRKLKSLTGKSPLDLIRDQRLHFAKKLLESHSMTVSEAAYQVGYSNISYFSKSFKKEFGVSPSEL